MRRLLPALLLTAACGAGLVDHDGLVLQGGGQLQCTLPQMDCGTGVCVNLDSDVNDCGACGFVCATPQHSTSTCTSSVCGFTCNPGYFACDSQGCCPASSIAAGGDTSCAVVDSSVRCWGSNASAQLGVSPADALWSAKPVAVPGVPAASSVSVGLAHVCAILAGTGEVMCWGANESGQLGVATGSGPVKVPNVSGATALALGDHHTCALTAAGAVCWGANDSGQLGGSSISVAPPAVVANTAGATSLTAGSAFNCAATASKLWCWGSNSSGQVLAGAQGPGSATPVENKSVSNVSITGAGSEHACAIGSSFWCWGLNSAGQLGDGSTSNGFKGVNLPAGATVVAGGALHTCAVAAGVPFCWGANASAQLGIGTFLPQLKPSQVALSAVQQIAAGSAHSCAQTSDGAVYCWGKNDSGQVAAPLSAAILSPRPID